MLTTDQIDFFNKFGFLHIKDFWTNEETQLLKGRALQNLDHDLISDLWCAEIFFSDKVLGTVRSLIGSDIVYFGDSGAGLRVAPERRKRFPVHNDARADDYDFSQPYPIVRLGTYPQDHKNFSGSLKLRPGSFKKGPCLPLKSRIKRSFKTGTMPTLYFGRWINIPSQPKDLIIWSLRTHHFPHGIRMKIGRELAFGPKIESLIPRFLQLPPTTNRCLISCTIGAPSYYLDNYISYIQSDPGYAKLFKNSSFDQPSIQNLANKKNVALRFDCLRVSNEA